MNRRAVRFRTSLSARIQYGVVKMDCELQDLSSSGARIALPPDIPLPHRFDLSIPERGETLACRLVWFEAGQCGVEFIDQTVHSDLPRRVLALEAEIAALRSELQDIRLELRASPPVPAERHKPRLLRSALKP